MWRELAQWLKGLPPANVAWVQFRPGAISGLSLFLVLAWLPGFSSKLSSFPSNTKTNAPNSSSARIEELHENQLRLMWLPLYILYTQIIIIMIIIIMGIAVALEYRLEYLLAAGLFC